MSLTDTITDATPIAPVLQTNSLLVPTSDTPMDLNFFNTRLTLIANAINSIGARMNAYDAEVATLVSAGLAQISTVLTPYLATLQEASQLGFLTATADGLLVSLTQGSAANWVITAGGALFMPTTYLLAVDNNDSTNWGIVKVLEWIPQNYNLDTNVIYASQTKQSTSWTLSVNAAVISAFQGYLTAAQAAQQAAVNANNSVQSSLATLGNLITAVQNGPVISVAGRSGAIVLSEADISGLAADLASKASVAALSGLQQSNTILNALAHLVLTANQLIYATSSTTLGTASISAYALSLLANSSATAMLSALGAAPNAAQFNSQLGTTYVFAASDSGLVVRLSNIAQIVVTLPNNMPIGWNCVVEQGSSGQVVFSSAAGSSLQNRLGQNKIAGQFGVVSLYVYSNSDGAHAVYNLSGDTA